MIRWRQGAVQAVGDQSEIAIVQQMVDDASEIQPNFQSDQTLSAAKVLHPAFDDFVLPFVLKITGGKGNGACSRDI